MPDGVFLNVGFRLGRSNASEECSSCTSLMHGMSSKFRVPGLQNRMTYQESNINFGSLILSQTIKIRFLEFFCIVRSALALTVNLLSVYSIVSSSLSTALFYYYSVSLWIICRLFWTSLLVPLTFILWKSRVESWRIYVWQSDMLAHPVNR